MHITQATKDWWAFKDAHPLITKGEVLRWEWLCEHFPHIAEAMGKDGYPRYYLFLMWHGRNKTFSPPMDLEFQALCKKYKAT